MPSYEQRFYRDNANVLVRLRRNLRLIAYLTAGLWSWVAVGRRARKAYRQAQDNSEAIYLEDYVPAEDE